MSTASEWSEGGASTASLYERELRLPSRRTARWSSLVLGLRTLGLDHVANAKSVL
jgi:hypothetical protein